MAALRDWLTQSNRWEIIVRAACMAGFLALAARFWDPYHGFTRFLQLDAAGAAQMTGALRDAPIYAYASEGRYDGAYYGQVASDPLLRDPELAGGVDSLVYRARRIGAPALAHALALGDRVASVRMYAALNVGMWLVLAAALWRLLPCGDARRLAAWVGVLFSAGVLHSVRLALVDLPSLVGLALAVLAIENRRIGWAAVALAGAALSRETALLAAGLLAGSLWRERARRDAAAILTAATIPVVAWILWLNWRLGPGAGGLDNFDWPLSGLWAKAVELATALRGEPDRALFWSTSLATVAGVAQAVFCLVVRRPGAALWWVGLGFALLFVPLDSAVWEGNPGAFTRVLLPLTLAFFVVAARERVAWPWFLAGALSLPAGLLALAHVPNEAHELSVGRATAGSYVARTDAAFYSTERGGGHAWAWASGNAEVALETWPRDARMAALVFKVRALQPRSLTVRIGGRSVWEGTVGTNLATVRVTEVPLSGGRAVLRFDSPAPPAREGAATGRLLAFALYDLRVE